MKPQQPAARRQVLIPAPVTGIDEDGAGALRQDTSFWPLPNSSGKGPFPFLSMVRIGVFYEG